MSRLLFAAGPTPGHVYPILSVAKALSERGHEVIFHTGELFREAVESVGLRFVPLPSDADFDHRDPMRGKTLPKEIPSSEPGLARYARMVGGNIPFQYGGLREILAKEKIDAILNDVLYMGTLPLLLRSEPRPAVIGCGVIAPMWLDPSASNLSGFSDAPGWRERNIAENRRVEEKRSVAWRYFDTILQEVGVAVEGGYNDNMPYRLPDIFLQFGAEGTEFPREEWQGNIVCVGALLPTSKGDSPVAAWLKTRDRSRPLIFVTQGTVANRDLEQLVRPAMEGLADEDVDVLTTGGGALVDGLVPPANARVESYIPYEDVLPEAAVFLTNGGYNGVQQALSCGVPVIVAGTTLDKPRVGHRVEWSGTGLNLKTSTPTKEQVREAVREILKNASYRERARAIQAERSQTSTIEAIEAQVEAAIVGMRQKG